MNAVVVPETAVETLSPAWRECIGTGRFSLALRKDYQDSLALVQKEIGFEYIRGHGILGDDVGIYRTYEYEGQQQVAYVFTYLDQIIDSYLDLGIKPFIELGFMPKALASGDQTVFWWEGNVTPPKSYSDWANLVKAVLEHLIDRYGLDNVRTWPVEVWNEPNLLHFWQDASLPEYLKLYEVTARAVKEVDSQLQVGGPAISPGSDEWWAPFIEFIEENNVPLDFVSRHAYTSGPSQHVPFGVYQTIAPAQTLLDQFAAPKQNTAGTSLAGKPVHITEFNSSYRPDNPVHDTAFNAAYLAPVLARGGRDAASFSYWTFSDMFEEEGIAPAIFHGGFGLLTHRQIKKPTFHLYAFFAKLGQEVLANGRDHLVTRRDDGTLAVLAWQPVGSTEDPPEPESHNVLLSLPMAGPSIAFALRSRVNEKLGNGWEAWRQMGRPQSPTIKQVEQLRELAEAVKSSEQLQIEDGRVKLDIELGRHEITLIEISPVADQTPAWLDDQRILGRN